MFLVRAFVSHVKSELGPETPAINIPSRMFLELRLDTWLGFHQIESREKARKKRMEEKESKEKFRILKHEG